MDLSRRQFGALFAAAAASQTTSPRPKLAVLLAVEQFRADYLDRYAHLFSPGGFRRLMDEGACFPNCSMLASTFSSTGLATIATGAYPDVHGIVADAWFDTTRKQKVTASGETIHAGTLADETLAAWPQNRVIGIGLNAAPVRMLLGKTDRTVCTVEAPSPAEPKWLGGFQKTYDPEKHKNARWMAVRPNGGVPPLRVLADNPAHPGEFQTLYRASPFAQEAQFALLRTALQEEKLGSSDGLDLVCVALSSEALLGYETGADSALMRELVLRLDRQIEQTLEALDKSPGAGNYALVFTAAHGLVAEPPAEQRRSAAISSEQVARAVDAALSRMYDVSSVKNRYVDRYIYPFLYLRHEQLRRYAIAPGAARVAAGRAALEVPGVAAYYTADGECSRASEWSARFRNSFHQTHSGDVMLAYQPGWVEETGAGRGISYGSLYNYDTQVPLIFFGPQFNAKVFETPVELVDAAPTLARAMQLAPPSAAVGRVLGEALASRPRSRK